MLVDLASQLQIGYIAQLFHKRGFNSGAEVSDRPINESAEEIYFAFGECHVSNQSGSSG